MPDRPHLSLNSVVVIRDSAAPQAVDWSSTLAPAIVSEVRTTLEGQSFLDAGRANAVIVERDLVSTDDQIIIEVLRESDREIPVFFVAKEMKASAAVRLTRSGADGCFDESDDMCLVAETIRQYAASHARRLEARATAIKPAEPWRATMVGNSPAMEEVAETVRLVGPRRCTVLITGETGTGKEVVARALHMSGPRFRQNFVAINCSALPENLLEAELFGHVRGAFTGAMTQRVGRFEQAHKGTLFLDEIGDMPVDLQAKLLRVLQEREFQRLGSSETVKVDIRVVAATNVDLQERIRQGKFREDLYYRLNVVPLALPPLRRRGRDVEALAAYFVARACESEGIEPRSISPEAMELLCKAPWPGNVRQLENAVERAVAVCGSREVLEARDFGLQPTAAARATLLSAGQSGVPQNVDFQTAVSRFELAMLNQALQQSRGNKTVAAEKLGIKRTTLIMKMRSLGGFTLQPA